MRRTLLVLGLGLLAPGAARSQASAAAAAPAPGTLRIATWDMYCDPARPDKPLGWAEFERETGAVVTATVFATNDEVVRAVRGGGYDLCIASCDVVPVMIAEGLLRPLPVARLANYHDLLPPLLHVRYGHVGRLDYCAPFSWGEMGLAYDTQSLPEAPRSWQILWEPAWRGRIAHWDDLSVLWTAALADDQRAVFALAGQPLWEAARRAARLSAAGCLFWRDEATQLAAMAAGRIVLNVTWPNVVAKANRQAGRERWVMVRPEEGATGFIDNVCVVAGTASPELADRLADFLIGPTSQLAMSAANDYAPSSAAAVQRLSPQRRAQLNLDDANRLNRLYLWRPIPNRDEYERLWLEARSGRLVQ
ncbi:MAG: ABC transporter substrate-binding protein [Candidatus Krumholzibacteriia bacterium]